jgi:hypothetical protein
MVKFIASISWLFVLPAQRGFITALPWQGAWVEEVVFEALNFSVLAAVCIVCRPTGTSKKLFYRALSIV